MCICHTESAITTVWCGTETTILGKNACVEGSKMPLFSMLPLYTTEST